MNGSNGRVGCVDLQAGYGAEQFQWLLTGSLEFPLLAELRRTTTVPHSCHQHSAPHKKTRITDKKQPVTPVTG